MILFFDCFTTRVLHLHAKFTSSYFLYFDFVYSIEHQLKPKLNAIILNHLLQKWGKKEGFCSFSKYVKLSEKLI